MATRKVARSESEADAAESGSYRIETLEYLKGDIESAKQELHAAAREIFAAYDCQGDEDAANACRFLALQKLNSVRMLLDGYTRVDEHEPREERPSEMRLRSAVATSEGGREHG